MEYTIIHKILLLISFSHSAHSQSFDPRVNITETDPPSDGYRVSGLIATDVLLNCYVENLGEDLQVRWQKTMYDKNGRETVQEISIDMSVQDNNKWSIEKPTSTSWRLRIKALTVYDEGNYTCFVRLTINNNIVESNRTVFAYSEPLILEAASSSDVFAQEGDMVPLRCNASGRPTPTIIWRRQGNAILPGGGVRHIGSILDIENIQYDARGLYICEAFNDVGYDRRDITLSIQHAPKISVLSESMGQALGYPRTLVCYIDSNPAPSTDVNANQLYWTRDAQRLVPEDERWRVSVMEGAYGRLTYELSIYYVQDDDYGVYTCHASTNLGNDLAEIELYKSDAPQDDKRGPVDSSVQNTVSRITLTLTLLLTLYVTT